MAYALETKKRKFDRILESLTDGHPSQPRSFLGSLSDAPVTSGTQDGASDASKRRRIALGLSSKNASATSLPGHYLPSSRTAFLDRLETFRHVTQWHVPSTEPINASAWAKQGWTCVDTDTVFCASCKERVHIDLELDGDVTETADHTRDTGDGRAHGDDGFSLAAEIYQSMIKRYLEMITSAHAESCPWRRRGCDASIQRIEGLLNTSNAISRLQCRYASIMARPDEIPDVAPLPAHPVVDEHELEHFEFDGQGDLVINALRLAVCGWQRKGEDVLECRNCFRSLGLWLYRGEKPAMDKLDAVDSHLEYCPWRCGEAQDTEVTTTSMSDSGPVQEKEWVPGWILVYQAVAKDNVKRRSSNTPSATPASDIGSSQTPEQREKKMKELLRRIKEIKKPFNVKALLKRKDTPRV